jgi:hypothetical protein
MQNLLTAAAANRNLLKEFPPPTQLPLAKSAFFDSPPDLLQQKRHSLKKSSN